MTVDIRVAGPLAVEATTLAPGGTPLRLASGDLPGRQGRLVLAALAVRGEAIDRDELAHLLWPEELPGSWRVDLSAVVSKLRAVLRPLCGGEQPITGGRGWYRLDLPGPVRVDVVDAERALVDAEQSSGSVAPAVLESVVAVTRRPFLPGDECLWVDERRAHQRRLHHRALTLRADLLRRAGAADALVAAEAVVEHEPLDEAGYLLLAEAQIGSGDRAGAVRTISALRERLGEELGLEPSAAAAEVERRALGVADGSGPDRLPLPPPLSGPSTGVVGRSTERDRLSALLASPGPGLVLVVGEAGVGKSTVAAAAARRHHEGGDAVLAGTCDADLGPMAAWSEALRRPVRSLADADGQLPGDPRGWGPLARLVPGGPTAGAGRAGRLADPDRDRAELFEAVRHLLDLIGGTPLVVLDDLHRADRPTLQLVEHLVTESTGIRLLATARRHELAEPSLRDLVARLRTEDRIQILELAGLDPAELGELVDVVTGSDTAARYPRLVPALHAATAGNPLYVREALRHLITSENLAGVRDGSSLFGATASPEGLEALIDANLARLGQPVRHLLEVAALVGPVAEVDLVIAVVGLPSSEAAAALDRAVQAGVLTEAGQDVRFTHPLVREVLVGSLTAPRRAALHRTISEAMAGGSGVDGDEASRARHLLRGSAEHGPGPIGPVKAAGDRALAAFAYDEAVTWYQRALELAEAAGARPGEVAELLVALGDALNRAGRVGEAREPLTAAVALARARRDPALLATAVLEQAKLLVDEGAEGGQVNQRLLDILEDALASSPPPPPALRARLRARLAMELHFAGDLERCLGHCRTADAEARASGDPMAVATVLGARHYSLYGSPRVQERLEIASELAEIGHSGRPDLRVIRNYLELGDVGALRSAVTEFDGGLPRGIASDRWVLEVWRAAEAVLEGRLDEAEELASKALQVGYVSSRGRAAVEAVQGGQLFAVRFFQGRLSELADVLVAVAAAAPERPIWRAAAALCHLQAGDRAGAVDHFERARGDGFERLAWSMDRPLTLAMLAWVGAEVGSDADVEALLELLRPYEELMIVNGAAPSIVAGPATYPLAVLAGRLGDVDRADAWFSEAEATDERWAARPWTALTELDHARHLHRAGRDRSATGRSVDDLRSSAAAIARAVGMPHVVAAAGGPGWT